ncbi:hypothetical protein [Photobacterium kishitanii]|uniref:hypothetical protein n=1 Tax=Photobacterium kishitanii TaxID=318456 RepID=UPI000D17C3E1|nr:hypothetical protein [Photobacterium kishitanii]PSU23836.1 hypothetical protein CTM84_02710 [Photobacterium kishitanii]
MYQINFSSPSIISSSDNSTEIRLILILLIIYICTKKHKNISYLKVCYIFSNLNKDNITNICLKDFIPTWDAEDIKLTLIYGSNNGLWDMNVKDSRISFCKNDITSKIYNNIIEDGTFSITREKIEKLSSISNAKLNRYKLVW